MDSGVLRLSGDGIHTDASGSTGYVNGLHFAAEATETALGFDPTTGSPASVTVKGSSNVVGRGTVVGGI